MSGRRQDSGFGLVEMMIAMVLGLLLVSAAVQVFLGVSASHRYSRALAEVQDSARFVMHALTRDLRLVGYFGCPVPPVSRLPSEIEVAPYGSIRVISRKAVETGIDGETLFDEALTLPGRALPDSADEGSDALRLAYVRDYGVRADSPAAMAAANLKLNANPADWDAGDELLVTDCRQADLFTATNVSRAGGVVTVAHAENRNTDPGFGKAYREGARVLDPRALVYYIRDGGGLYRREHFAETEATDSIIELAPNVSDLIVRYGVDGDADGMVDVYRTGEVVESDNEWSDVVAVRVGFVAASATQVGNEAGETTLKVLGQSVNPPDDGRLRRVFTATVALRNRVP